MIAVDFDALTKNALFFRKLVGNKKLFAVLKNNAYGHGLVRVASQINHIADIFAVGSVAEAEKILFLRNDVLVLLPQSSRDTEQAINDGIILTVDSFETLRRVDSAAKRLNKAARIHLKIDSGMSRLGFTYSQTDRLVNALRSCSVNVEGIFSHFYGDTAEACDAQLDYFVKCRNILSRSFPNAICHIANTGATLLSSKYHLDGVRVGLGLFGYGNEALVPVKKAYAKVIAVRTVDKGAAVGYGAKYICAHPTNIAVLNVGYANGLPRILVGKKIKIGEKFFPIAAICMAMTLVDTGNAHVYVGDTATLLGDGVDLSDEKVIIYELLCNLQ